MNTDKQKLFLYLVIGALSAFLAMYLFNNYKIEKKSTTVNSENTQVLTKTNDFNKNTTNYTQNSSKNSPNSENIKELTNEKTVINYVKQNHQLPDCYLTKSEARRQGWNPSAGNLCDVLPGKAIGGDHFSNREKNLPSGNQYFEADVNFSCGNRNADRIVFTKEGDVYLSKNHYKSFQKQ